MDKASQAGVVLLDNAAPCSGLRLQHATTSVAGAVPQMHVCKGHSGCREPCNRNTSTDIMSNA